jgi:parallel beta-helix repeat protein
MDNHPAGTTYCIEAGTFHVGSLPLRPQDGDRLVGAPVTMTGAPEGGMGKLLTTVPTKIVGSSDIAVIQMPTNTRGTFVNLDVSGARIVDADSTGKGIHAGASVIRRCRIHDNQGVGINVSGLGFIVEDTELFANGSSSYLGTGAAGIKITADQGSGVVRRVYSHDNVGNGMWTDCGTMNTTIEDNTVVRNFRKGIFVEISRGPVAVLRNVVKTNNSEDGFTAGGIAVMSSRNVHVEGNTLDGNQRASINVRMDARAGNGETVSCRLGFVPDQIVVSGNSLGGEPLLGCSLTGVSCGTNTL